MAVVGPGAPYITPSMLLSASTGISWSTLGPPKATPDQQAAEQLNICMRATASVDKYCCVPLRATIDTETVRGPGDFRFQVQSNGTARLLLSRPPVVSVISGQVSPTDAFPSRWSSLAADRFKVDQPMMGVYGTSAPGVSDTGGQAVLLAPGVVRGPKGAWEVQVTYLNGWPHTQLVAAAAPGDTMVTVDDVTGWLGALGTIRDPLEQETATVIGVTPSILGALSGPGALTLSAPLAYAHAAGTLFSTLPGTVQEAAILFAVSQALVRGATSISPQSMNGGGGGGSKHDSAYYKAEAELLIQDYRRTL